MNDRLKKIRKELNLTQEEFAQKIDLSRSGFAGVEVGNAKLTDRNIKKICKVFNVNEHWLRTGEGEMFNTVEEDKELLNFVINIMADKDEFIKKTFVTLARLNDEEWAVIKKIINSLKNK
jgi:transcriptional regulator with XRE-family HTH domain